MVNSNTSKPPWVTRGSNQIVFFHDSEHARIKQAGATGTTLYLNGAGVMSERLNGSGGTTQWTDYLFAGGEMIGMRVEHLASGRERGGSASEVRSYERQVLAHCFRRWDAGDHRVKFIRCRIKSAST